MPRLSLLAAVFVVSLLIWIVWAFPAGPLVDRLDGMNVAGSDVQIRNVSGRIWDGRGRWQWRDWRGDLAWRVTRLGWRPALELDVRSGDIRLAGRVSGGGDWFDIRELELRVPLAAVTANLPQGGANGWVEGNVERLAWHAGGAVEASGQLEYSGGDVSWQPDGGANVPRLTGALFEEQGEGHLRVKAPGEQVVMEGRLTGEMAEIRVFRAWPRLLGVSQGGQDDDVVFQVSERLQAPQ